MYNEELKRRYISSVKANYSESFEPNIISLFNKSSQIEEMFGKDVSLFSHEDIANMYSLFSYADSYVYGNVNTRFLMYTNWCIAQNLVPDGCNHFAEFTFEDFSMFVDESLESRKYITRDELLKIVNRLVNPRDQFLFLCLFEIGKSDYFRDILEMSLEDISFESNSIMLQSGRIVKVSDLLLDKALQANGEMKYYSPNSERERPLMPSQYIFKKVKTIAKEGTGVHVNNKLVTKIIKTCLDHCGGNYGGLNASSIAVSGQLDMIRKEAEKLGISREEYVRKHFSDLKKQYEMSPDNSAKYIKKYGAYL